MSGLSLYRNTTAKFEVRSFGITFVYIYLFSKVHTLEDNQPVMAAILQVKQ